MFEIYKKKVTVELANGDSKEYELLPLRGRFYPKVLKVLNDFNKVSKSNKGDDDSQDSFFENIDEDGISRMHELVLETLKSSYKVTGDEGLESLDMFVSQNLFKFITPIIELNLGAKED